MSCDTPKKTWLLILSASFACLAFGCAAVTGVPRGSVLIGIYKGTFNGAYNEGFIKVKLYQAPDGSKQFYGDFDQQGSYLHFSGAMQEGELQGQIFLPVEGTITGKLSPDDKLLSGDYKFTVPPLNTGASHTWSLFDHGTWQAVKQ